MSRLQFQDADAAAALIRDGDTVAISGNGAGMTSAEAILAAIERRFLATGHPRDLTLVHSLGLGDRGELGTNRFAHEGLLRRVIAAHFSWSSRIQEMVRQEKIEAYCFPGGVIQHLLRDRDKLKLFELHPTDAKTLSANIAQLDAGRQVAVLREDGFEGLKKFLPPPARRALVLCDPSYEIKSDYARVPVMVDDALTRFATGTYMVWYPLIPRPEAHDVPRKLKTLATRAGKSWLNANLTVKSSKLTTDEAGEVQRPGLPASGVFIINPPHTLKAALQAALPQLVAKLAQDEHAAWAVDNGG